MVFLSLQHEAFGLDISDLSLKIARLKRKGRFYQLRSWGKQQVPDGVIEEGEVKDPEKLSQFLRSALSQVWGEKIRTKYVVASLPEEKAYLEVIQMPRMPKEELENAVRFEVENHIPLAIEEVYLDFKVLEPLQDNLDHLDILIAALPKEIVDPYLASLKAVGLRPLALEIESEATARALVENQISPTPLLLLDLGATRTGFIIFSGNSVRLTSSIRIAGGELTRAIARKLEISGKEAEKIKKKWGLNQNIKLKLKNGFQKEIKKGEIFRILEPALKNLINEIKKYLNYYQSHASHEHLPPNGQAVEMILLAGGGAQLKGLASFLQQELQITTRLANPFINLPSQPNIPALAIPEALGYATALGLAMRGISGD